MRVVTDPTPEDLEAAFALRERVFVVEQRVPPALERDGGDREASHVVVFDDVAAGAEAAVATGRVRLRDGYAKVERVAVERARRGAGLGRVVMAALEARARALGAREVRLAAQVTAVGFYERLGYEAFGEPFVEAGIVHRWMRRDL